MRPLYGVMLTVAGAPSWERACSRIPSFASKLAPTIRSARGRTSYAAPFSAKLRRCKTRDRRSGLAGLGDEAQRHAVVAIALPGRRRAVVEYMAVVPAAARTVILGARKNQLEVAAGAERAGNGGEKAGPAGAAVEFHDRGEKRQAAARAYE